MLALASIPLLLPSIAPALHSAQQRRQPRPRPAAQLAGYALGELQRDPAPRVYDPDDALDEREDLRRRVEQVVPLAAAAAAVCARAVVRDGAVCVCGGWGPAHGYAEVEVYDAHALPEAVSGEG